MIKLSFRVVDRNLSPVHTYPFCVGKGRIFCPVFQTFSRPHLAFFNRFCPSTQKRNSNWKRYHLQFSLMEAYAFTGIQHRDVIAPFLSIHSSKAKRRFQNQTTWIWLLMTCLCCLRCCLCNLSLLWEISTLESVFKDAFSATAFTGQWRIQTFR